MMPPPFSLWKTLSHHLNTRMVLIHFKGSVNCVELFHGYQYRPKLCDAAIPEKTKPRRSKDEQGFGITGGQGQNRTADTRIIGRRDRRTQRNP